jgi:acyl-CoA thioester hydrolase
MKKVVQHGPCDRAPNGRMIAGGCRAPKDGAGVGPAVETGGRRVAGTVFPAAVTAGLRVVQRGRSSIRRVVGPFALAAEAAAAAGFLVHVRGERATWRPVPVPAPRPAAREGLLSG